MGGNSSKEEEKYMNEEDALDLQFNKLKNSDLPIVRCDYINNDKKHWKLVFTGSQCSPYDDGYFILELLFNKGVFPKF